MSLAPRLLIDLARARGPLPDPLLTAMRYYLAGEPAETALRYTLVQRPDLPGEVVRELHREFRGQPMIALEVAYLNHPTVTRSEARGHLDAAGPDVRLRYAQSGHDPVLLAGLAADADLSTAVSAAANRSCPDDAAAEAFVRSQRAGASLGESHPPSNTLDVRRAARSILESHPNRKFLLTAAAACTDVVLLLDLLDTALLEDDYLDTVTDLLLDGIRAGRTDPGPMFQRVHDWLDDGARPRRNRVAARIADGLSGHDFPDPQNTALARNLTRAKDTLGQLLSQPVPAATETLRDRPQQLEQLLPVISDRLGESTEAWLMFTRLSGTFTGTFEELLTCCAAVAEHATRDGR